MSWRFLSFYVADQITVQRYLTAKSLEAARRSFVLNCLSVSIMVPALMYTGIALLAFYHDHPDRIAADLGSQRRSSNSHLDPRRGGPTADSPGRLDAITPDTSGPVGGGAAIAASQHEAPVRRCGQAWCLDEQDGRRVDVQRLAMRLPRSDSAGEAK